MARGAGGSVGRSAPGTGGVNFGIEARGDGGAAGAADGATGAIGVGGVTISDITGVFSGAIGAVGAVGAASGVGSAGTAAIGTIGVPPDGRMSGAGGFVAEATSPVIAVISREAREITPGVNVGVGLREAGIPELNGVGYGIDARPADGVTFGALGVGSADAAAAAGAAGATMFGVDITAVGMRGAAGAGVARRVRAGVIVSGAASASDSIATRS